MIYVKFEQWTIKYAMKVAGNKEKYDQLRGLFPVLPEDPEQIGYGETKVLADWDTLTKVSAIAPKEWFSLEPFEHQMLTLLSDRVRALEARAADKTEQMLAGSRVSIHVPDMVLLQYNEVTHLDDACTDLLQDHLNDGWRILAVCPPNSARRPDYILGRRKKGT